MNKAEGLEGAFSKIYIETSLHGGNSLGKTYFSVTKGLEEIYCHGFLIYGI